MRDDGTLGVRSGAKRHPTREAGFFIVHTGEARFPLARPDRGDRLPGRPTVRHTPTEPQRNTIARAEGLLLDVKEALTGETVFSSLLVDAHEEVRLCLRRLQYHTFKKNQDAEGKRIRLMFQERLLEPSMPLLSNVVDDNEGIVLQSMADELRQGMYIRLELQMVAQPVLLSWTQLTAMPLMRKRAGRGERGAFIVQRRLRHYCYERNTREVDLSRSDYDWRLLLRNMPRVLKYFEKSLLAGGVVGFRFCLLDQEDPNYAHGRMTCSHADELPLHPNDTGDRHVFEMSCADGHLCHMHFHRRRPCDVAHIPYEGP